MVGFAQAGTAADNRNDSDFFENRVRPVLEKHCMECHSSATKIKGGLSLDSKKGWEDGGDSGPALIPGNPEESLILEAISWRNLDLQMPPKNKLPDRDRQALEEWVKRGAFDPRETAANSMPEKKPAMSVDAGRQFWSYKPLQMVAVPVAGNSSWPLNDIDHFVLAGLNSKGLVQAQDASSEVIVRRLSYVLTGLPPTEEQLQRSVGPATEETRQETARLVDELLESTAFAERFASHWLDITRFAESSGGGRTLLFKDAWRYRDYVVQSFSENRPLDQMIREHIAGDLMRASDHHDRERQIVASGFLAFGPTVYEEQDKQQLRYDVIDEQIDTIGKAFLGQTIGCSRCHDHKFDPIPQRDYYALAGIFASTRTLFNYTDNVARWVDTNLPLDDARESQFAEAETKVAALEKTLKQKKNELAKLKDVDSGVAFKSDQPIPITEIAGIALDDVDAKAIGNWKHSTHSPHYFGKGYIHDDGKDKGEKTLTFTPNLPNAGRYEVRFAYSGITGRSTRVPIHIFHAMGDSTVYIDQTKSPDIEGRFVSLGTYQFDKGTDNYVIVSNEGTSGYVVADAVQFLVQDQKESKQESPTQNHFAQELRSEIKKLESELSETKKLKDQRPIAMSVRDEQEIRDTEIRIRGEVHQLGPVVPRGFLSVVSDTQESLPADQSGRIELANWIVSNNNPLAARVMVNRVWSWVYGYGLVRSVDNFGTTGEAASHPELLDYLANRFQREGWDLRSLVREMVLARTWQLSVARQESDPDNIWLSHAHRRRLDAEQIRDAILTVGGNLDPAVGGPNIKGANSAASDSGDASSIEFGYRFEDTRRSLYTPAFRNNRLELFAIFDFGDINTSQGQRHSTTVAPQALYFMNHPFVIEQSLLAGSKAITSNESDDQRLAKAFMRSLGRLPTPAEKSACDELLRSVSAKAIQPEEGWSMIYQSLFGSVDFRYIH